ncbi:tryptophan 7-halogenase [Rhizobium sp.]|jgi:flavin-dependent dehydrogenase|uniref:NAD(P)/FAD-dependent oxidoreductase n=1 Tax=Rhizobium sp. TaxID=391 RepID=UPI000E8492D2|nr:FAD-binding monooxygenase [Rhizobium sp.]
MIEKSGPSTQAPTLIPADVVVVGAGPAGASFALNLASFHRVLLIDKQQDPMSRIGESLAAAARRLLADMGLWEDFLLEGHSSCHGGQSIWGSAAPAELDSLRDLDGPGWHLDRHRFTQWLRQAACVRGAAVLAPALIETVTRGVDGGWIIDLTLGDRPLQVRPKLVVDAGGRGSPLAKQLGATRTVTDKLVCRYLHGTDIASRQSGITHIEAEADGWWYSAPLPGGRRVLAFHTDADLPAAQQLRDTQSLMQRLQNGTLLPKVLTQSGFRPEGETGFCAAHSSHLDAAFGEGWMAIGDAAISFDPLSSQGLFNALYAGLAAAEAADRYLGGEHAALASYGDGLQPIQAAYRHHLQAWYGMERRFQSNLFWQRRHQMV